MATGYGYSIPGIDQSVAVPYTAGGGPSASQVWGGTASDQPAWWGNAIGTEATTGGGAAWGDKLTKALGDLSKGANATNQAAGGSGGGPAVGSMAPAQSGTGGGGGASQLAALVQLLAQRYQQLYPGGGSSKGLLGV